MWTYKPYSPQNRKKVVIFGMFTEKAEYRSTTTNLPVCNDIIIVLKITLQSVSIITNFVIPKHDRQTDKKTSHFLVYS